MLGDGIKTGITAIKVAPSAKPLAGRGLFNLGRAMFWGGKTFSPEKRRSALSSSAYPTSTLNSKIGELAALEVRWGHFREHWGAEARNLFNE